MSSYTHFTLEERKYLQKILSKGYSIRCAAAVLGRSPSSVSRELRRNRAKYKPHRAVDNPYWYNHWRAQNLYIRRRREQVRSAIKPGTEPWAFIVRGLTQWWSPGQICGRWHMEHLEEIRQRTRVGDWEGDTVYGGIGKGLLVTLVDRNSRYVRIGLLRQRTAEGTRQVIEQRLERFPVKSISLDNGSEFAQFRQLEETLQAPVYFAEPHKPWQRGTNENTNDLIRFFFPKGYDFRTVTKDDIARVEQLLNSRPRSRPRKCLGWRSPAEVFGVALA